MTLCENKTDQNTNMLPNSLNNIYCKMLLTGQNISDQVITEKKYLAKIYEKFTFYMSTQKIHIPQYSHYTQ